MMSQKTKYNLLADVFRYPKDDYFDKVKLCGDFLLKNHKKAYGYFEPFIEILSLKNRTDCLN